MNEQDLHKTDELLALIQQGQASDADYQELLDLLAANPEADVIRYLQDYFEEHSSHAPATAASASDPAWQAMLQTVLSIDKPRIAVVRPVHRVHLWKTAWFRTIAAAVLILIIGTLAYLWKTDRTLPPTLVTTNPVPMRNDVAPGGNRAVLTLADGRTINLDSAANGQLASVPGAVIRKTQDGQVEYTVSRAKNALNTAIGLNTMRTPKGGQYELRLPDGTHVWLNAESSITYPVVFTTNERKVSITGEAYFEVTKNTAAPFYVQTKDVTVKVLGTHFNVNAYANEEDIKTTLLEGSVKIISGPISKTIIPNQQAVAGKNHEVNISKQVDVGSVMAWKNGRFAFQEADIQTIMRQVERWYDVQVIYQATIDQHFVANIPRNVPVSKLLHLLELTNHVHFKIQNKTITVLP